jgi:hypothetical protein
MPVSRAGTSLPQRPEQHRAQETKDENEARIATGKVNFLPAFRNLPPVLCVPMPEQDFVLDRWSVLGEPQVFS